MKSHWMKTWLLVAGVISLVFGHCESMAHAQKGGRWKMGMPIVTYWAGPAMTDAAARQLAEGGWNVVWCGEKELDVAQRHGLRGQLTDPLLAPEALADPTKREALDALISRVRKHPALYCYFITDEPDAGKFQELGKLVAYLKEKDPKHLAYINLFPTYASNEQLGNRGDTVTAYKAHLKQYVEVVKPALISYDHYQFAIKSDLPDYFLNLALVRNAAMEAGVPFLNIVQACTWDPAMREPKQPEMRYLIYTSLAYGATGISYYVYSHPGHSPGIATLDGKTTHVYDWLKTLNPEFTAIASEVQPLRSSGVFHAGMMPPGAVPLPINSPFTLDPAVSAMEFKKGEPVKGVLLGCFGRKDSGVSGSTHAVVVNLDYRADATINLRGPHNLEVFDATTRAWTPRSDRHVTLNLPPGGGVLVRVGR